MSARRKVFPKGSTAYLGFEAKDWVVKAALVDCMVAQRGRPAWLALL
jgi:hypothetical protein